MIDINFFASDGLLDCLLVCPFGLAHPHASGGMDFLFDDRLFTAQWNLDNLFSKRLLARADLLSRNAFNNNVFAFQLDRDVDLFRSDRLVLLYFASTNRPLPDFYFFF